MREDALIIEKRGTVLYEQPRDDSTDMTEGVLGAHQTHGILGILTIELNRFLVIITEKQLVAKSPGEGNSIYEISQIDFIPFDPKVPSYQNIGC